MPQIIAGVIFAQSLKTVENSAIGHHRFNPEDLVARHAIAQHIDPAGIGGEQSANLRRAF